MTEMQRIKAVPKTKGHTGNVWSQDYDPKAMPAFRGGFVMQDTDTRPAAYDHHNIGTDFTWRDAQSGASVMQRPLSRRRSPLGKEAPISRFGEEPRRASIAKQ